MRLLYYSAATPEEDVALEEAIHTAVEDGSSPDTWRIWQARGPAVILGTGQESAKEADLEAATREGVSVLRRHSGGGAVLIGPGTINFSMFFLIRNLAGSETIRGAMSAALVPVIKVLQGWGLRTSEAGLSDLAVMGNDGLLRKIAGNSQARKKVSVVVHGTMLADPDWARLNRLLRFPSKAPDYRAGRDHRGFLTSLKENEAPFDPASFTAALMSLEKLEKSIEPSPNELSRAARLVSEKYQTKEWNLRR